MELVEEASLLYVVVSNAVTKARQACEDTHSKFLLVTLSKLDKLH